jgi:hypothetical protein
MRYLETLRRMYWISRLKHQGQASFADKLRWWRHGFRPSSAQMYRFPRADMHQYVSDYAENYGSLHLNPVESVFNHKALQQSLLQAAGAVMPELVAVLYGGRAVLHPLTPRARPVGAAELANALVAGGGEYIIKPDCGGGGDKVALLQVEEGAVVRSDGHDRAVFDAEAWGKQVMLIQRRAEPAAFWRDLWPGSINTIRVLTLWRDGEVAPFIAGVVQRIGTEASLPVDNYSRGGVAAPVDPATGRLAAASRRTHRERRLSHHPDTGRPIEGEIIPNWDGIRAEVLRLTGALPLNCFVGWDVFVNQEDRVAVCEMNGARSTVTLLQLDRGLLGDNRVREYYEEQHAL